MDVHSGLARVLTVASSPCPSWGSRESSNWKRVISSAVLDHPLFEEEKKTAGPLVHYAYGTGIGALYGGLVQRYKPTKSGFGTAYGAAAWALGDEIAVPAFGLGKKPTEAPASNSRCSRRTWCMERLSRESGG